MCNFFSRLKQHFRKHPCCCVVITIFICFIFFNHFSKSELPDEANDGSFHFKTSMKCSNPSLTGAIDFYFNQYLERYIYYITHEYGYCASLGCNLWVVPRNNVSHMLEKETYKAFDNFMKDKIKEKEDINYFGYLLQEINAVKMDAKDIKYQILKDNFVIFDDVSSITLYKLEDFSLDFKDDGVNLQVVLHRTNDTSLFGYTNLEPYLIKDRYLTSVIRYCDN